MRESDRYGDQDLTFWIRALKEVLREVLGDERMAGHKHFTFEMLINEEGDREFGASNGAVSFQIAQLRSGPDCDPVSLVIYIDGSFIKHWISVKPIYGMAQLSDPNAVFPFRNTEEVRENVAQERRRLLHKDGTPRDRCKAEVCYIRSKYVIY